MASDKSPMMHSTYFKLKEGSTRASYIDACHEYLSTSKGMMSFWVGELADDLKRRDVSDLDFDVAMHQVFQNKQMFDLYNGQDPRHDQFVSEVNRWAAGTTRRVLDSYLDDLYIGEGQGAGLQPVAADGTLPRRLMHSIYFLLNDKSQKAKLRDICVKLLSDHPGVCVFAVGEMADLKRDVSVTNFDVSVDIEWMGKQFYEEYLKSESHKDFFPATQGMIASTHVFDSYLHYERNDRVYA